MKLRSLCVVLMLLSAAHVAVAAGAEDKLQAKNFFLEGRRLYDVGEFRSALASFKKAYLHYEEASFLFNIAQCYRQLNEKPEALNAYKSYLRRNPEASNRPEVLRLIALLETAISDDVKARQAPPPADTTLSPGDRRQAGARADESQATTPSTDARPSPEAKIAAPSQEAVTAQSTPSERRAPVYRKWWLWTAVAGVVVVGVGVGVGVYYATHQFDSTLPGFTPGSALTVGF